MILLNAVLFLSAPQLKLQVDWEKPLFELGIPRQPLVAVSSQGTICVAEKRGSALAFLDENGTLLARIPWQSKGPYRINSLTSLSQADGFAIGDELTHSVGIWDAAGKFLEARAMNQSSVAFSSSGKGTHYYFQESGIEEGRFVGLYQWSLGRKPVRLWSHVDPDLKKGDLPTDINLTRAAFGTNRFALVTPKNKILVRSFKDPESGFEVLPDSQWPKGKRLVSRSDPDTPDRIRKQWLIQNTVAHIELDGQDHLWVFGYPIGETTIRPFAYYGPDGDLRTKGRLQDLPIAVTPKAIFFLYRLNNQPILQKVSYFVTQL